ncbi:MAG: hypothetical protein KBT01_10230, partial [Clostridiales bacterium]|nr:hypothetical protein [Candidatus Blautia equi]
VDTGNNRILQYQKADRDSLKLIRIIDSFNAEDGYTNTFKGPTDIAISEEGDIFVADKDNNRIVKLDSDLNYLLEFTKPKDDTYDQSLSFQPSKITVDSAGRVYCVATNANKGLIKYENDGTFTGFVGAIPVTFDFMDYVWKRLATQAQREALASFVPTEYDNLYMDYEGFIYACTTHVTEEDLDSGSINPIRKLNLMGNDILVRNGEWPIFGDLYWGNGGGYKGPSMLNDVTVMENDVYFALDRTRGRIFAYDDQGRMVFCFGGRGNMDGYFKQPTAIDHMGHDLYVLDALDSSITIFTPTTYGNAIYNAIEQFQDGQYEASGESWEKVMAANGNYDLAYIGIGRSLLRQKKYEEAMEYFKLKMDDENYSKAFKQYRKIWVEEHIGWILAVLGIVIFVPLIIGRIKDIRHEIDTADIFTKNWGKR